MMTYLGGNHYGKKEDQQLRRKKRAVQNQTRKKIKRPEARNKIKRLTRRAWGKKFVDGFQGAGGRKN